ncbi:MAG TPA: methylmalonyl Co-A mutase-associated GTPase MeaB [Polyangia bacterium]|nr:methylmalonyl Co-A mutase-associated GTPase MeaB [Polyangia bacterium]
MAAATRVERVLGGEPRALAQLLRDLDDGLPAARDDLRALYPRTGQAQIIGITGNPGVGKSTLVDGLITRYRARGLRVGVVAVDPSSPFSGGALLGDRIRMQRHATDGDVFIRSLATRGQMGGLSRSTADVAAALDAARFGVVIIETVGVGQDEIDVITAADTVVVVTAPGLGDDVQALKAGILEIADVLVVNKGDREGADRTLKDLTVMLDLARPVRTPAVALLRAVAATGEGLDALCAALDERRHLPDAARSARRRQQAQAQLTAILAEMTRRLIDGALGTAALPGPLGAVVEQLAARTVDPYTAAQAVLSAGIFR